MYILMYVRTPLAQPVIGPDKDAACARQPAAERPCHGDGQERARTRDEWIDREARGGMGAQWRLSRESVTGRRGL